jgi:protein-arginine kinase activator protein McsA
MKVCTRCKQEKPLDEFHLVSSKSDKRRSICKECRRELERIRRRALREEVLKEYGYKCACCGESREEFLAIDHINGGGNTHRRLLRSHDGLYRYLKKNGFPKDNFRLLCHNCNMAIGIYGYCPHQGE